MKSHTGARGLTAIYIIIYHFFSDFANGKFPRVPLLRPMLGHGYFGVVFFFQLSGFVNTIVNESRGTDYSTRSFQNTYWWKRFARLMPVYWASLLLFLPILISAWGRIEALPFDRPLTRWVAVAATATATQSWDPTVPLWRMWNYPAWAVSCEVVFYFLFPFLVPLLKPLVASRRACAVLLVALWALELLVWLGYTTLLEYWGFISGEANDVTYTFPLVRINEFLIGIVLGLLFLQRHRGTLEGSPTSRTLGRVADLSFAATLVLLCGLPMDIPIPVCVAVMSPLCGLWVYATALDGGVVAGFLTRPWLLKLGELSYCVYIVQESVMMYTLWALNAEGDELGEIFNMVLNKALGIVSPNCPTLPTWSLPIVLLGCHVLGYGLFRLVEVPSMAFLTAKGRPGSFFR